MPFRPCPSGCGRVLSADDGHDRCLQCLGLRHAEAAFVDDSLPKDWLMRLLWAYEHDFAAISPLLYERIGTLCRHPCWSIWLEQRIAGWRSRRSEGYCKSLQLYERRKSRHAVEWIVLRSVPQVPRLLPCVGARRLFGRHLQSCGLGDTEHLRKILQSPRWASFFPCVG